MADRLFNFNVLTSMIIISNDPGVGDIGYSDVKYIIKEVSEVKIESSYNSLINKAEVTLPRATIIEATTSKKVGVKTKELMGDGTNSIFRRGQRITIWLGYDDDGSNRNNKKMFDGYIVSVVPDNPYTLYCEDFGYKLKTNAVKPFSSGKQGCKINDVIGNILEGTGLKLHPLSERMNINIGNILIEKSKSAADILESWKKFGLLSFIKYYQGQPYLAISRTFFSVNSGETLIAGDSDVIPIIDFQDNVANDDLQIMQLDSSLLALTAVSLYPDNSRIQLTIIRDKAKPSEFQVINETKLTKKQIKRSSALNYDDMVENYRNTKNKQDKFDLSAYNVRTYHEFNLDRDELIKNAKSAFNSISQTGIEGTITLFGDFGLQPASMVRLYDRRNTDKNGVYVVSEVETTFGSGGYRQKIKIPYKRSN